MLLVKVALSLESYKTVRCTIVAHGTGREINFFFSESHLAPKFFKVVANSRKVGRHFQRQTKPLFYAVIAPVLGAISCPEVAR